MQIAITMTQELAKYAVKDGKIYFVKVSKPCAISDLDDQFSNISLAPHINRRTLSYGIFVENADGYSASPRNIRKVTIYDSERAYERFAAWCNSFGCNLTWEEAKALAGWN